VPNIRVVELSSDDAWVRDSGPTFVINDHGEVRGVNWDFNAWGGFDGGLYCAVEPRPAGGQQGAGNRAVRRATTPKVSCSKGARSMWMARAR
jgi:hypothetical protein